MVVVGRVSAPFGVRGWVKIQVFSESPEHLLAQPVWSLGRDDQWRAFKVLEARQHGASVIAALEGVGTREAAATLKGLRVALERAQLPEPGQDEFYWADLIGLAVRNTHGDAYGEVADMVATGANDVLVVKGERERLIPFIAQAIVSVDLEARVVTVDWPADF